MSEFKVGDKVKIRKESEYYGDHPTANPADVVGVVSERIAGAPHPVEVQWPSGTNVYKESDLEHCVVEVTEKDDLYTDLEVSFTADRGLMNRSDNRARGLLFTYRCARLSKEDFLTAALKYADEVFND